MSDTDRLLLLAVERGWLTPDQAQSGGRPESLLSPEQIEQLRDGRKLASRVLESGLLKGEALADEAPLRFGRYTLVRELGQGASGRVYLARDPDLGRDIAIKILDRGVAAQPERFRREMGILAALRHPNIVTIFDASSRPARSCAIWSGVSRVSIGGADRACSGVIHPRSRASTSRRSVSGISRIVPTGTESGIRDPESGLSTLRS